MLGSSYPILDIFWTMLEVFLLVVWLFILFSVVLDIFRSHDIKGWVKAVWLLAILILPLIGVLVYLIARGGTMHERSLRAAQAQDEAFKQYVRQAAGSEGSASTADQLAKLADLHQRGVLSDEEFQKEKAKVLATA